jgi:uncharacterized cupin superfamily protein
MTAEIKSEMTFPEDVLAESARDLFERALEILRNNEDLARTLLQQYLSSPRELGVNAKHGKKIFESRGSEYHLDLERGMFSDKISLRTTNEGIEEQLNILVFYKEDSHENREIKKGHVSFFKRNWNGQTETESYINNSKATQKIRDFLRMI